MVDNSPPNDLLSSNFRSYFAKHYLAEINNIESWNLTINEQLKKHSQIANFIEHYAAKDRNNLDKIEQCIKQLANLYLDGTEANKKQFSEQLALILLYIQTIHVDFDALITFISSSQANEMLDTLSTIRGPVLSTIKQIQSHIGFDSKSSCFQLYILTCLYLYKYIANSDINNKTSFKKSLANHEDASSKINNFISALDEHVYAIICDSIHLLITAKHLVQCQGFGKFFGICLRIIDHNSGDLLYSFPIFSKTILLKGSSNLVTGEANIECIRILNDHTLIVSFHKDLFADYSVDNKMIVNTAFALSVHIRKILKHISFLKRMDANDIKIRILLEETLDNAEFVTDLLKQLQFLAGDDYQYFDTITAFSHAPEIEQDRFLTQDNPINGLTIKDKISKEMAQHGYHLKFTDLDAAFIYTKLVQLDCDEVLFPENSQPAFAYIPFDIGLQGHSEFSKTSFSLPAWNPVGHIGVIENSKRKATILATKPLTVLMIPAKIYLEYWHKIITEQDIYNHLKQV